MIQQVDLERLLAQASPVVREAGTLLRSMFGDTVDLAVQRKKDQSYVSQADLASEQLLKAGLHTILPEASFFAEESGQSGNGPYHWVIDPLDGTTNFVHGLPYWCVSVALTYEHKPLIAMIYNPLTEEFFHALSGGGAFCNDQLMRMGAADPLGKKMVVIGLPYTKHAGFLTMLEHIPQVAKQAYAFRHFGAAALDQAYVAKGGLDGICFPRLGWWDIAAGMLLISEAGGILSDFQGKPLDYQYESYLAGSAQVHKELLKICKTSIS